MKKLFFVLASGFLLACGKGDRPSNIVSKEKIVKVLIDIHLLEEKLKLLNVHPDSAEQLYKAYEWKLLEDHGLDTTTYRANYDYYAYNVIEMAEIYEMVVDSLLKRQKEVESEATKKHEPTEF